MTQPKLGGTFTFPNTQYTVNRLGYGAMQLAGPGVWGPPPDVDAAIAVLREAVAAGVNHIDTSDFYGPHVTNQIIKQALHPYPADLVHRHQGGCAPRRDKSWIPCPFAPGTDRRLHDNLRNLGLERARRRESPRGRDAWRPSEGAIEEPLTILAELKHQGLIRHIGLSNVTTAIPLFKSAAFNSNVTHPRATRITGSRLQREHLPFSSALSKGVASGDVRLVILAPWPAMTKRYRLLPTKTLSWAQRSKTRTGCSGLSNSPGAASASPRPIPPWAASSSTLPAR